jgi:hypothetical protein
LNYIRELYSEVEIRVTKVLSKWSKQLMKLPCLYIYVIRGRMRQSIAIYIRSQSRIFEKVKIIVKYCQFKYNYHWCCKIDAIFIQQYKQNLLNFRHHFLFGVPSSIILQIKHYSLNIVTHLTYRYGYTREAHVGAKDWEPCVTSQYSNNLEDWAWTYWYF